MLRRVLRAAVAVLVLGGCDSSDHTATPSATSPTPRHPPAAAASSTRGSRTNVYRADFAGDLSHAVRGDPALVYVPNSMSNTVDRISQRTMKIVEQFATGGLPQHTPYRRYVIVVAERLQRVDFRDPNTMGLERSLSVPECCGVDHMDFSANGRYAYASYEFSGRMIEVDLHTQRVIATLVLRQGIASPQDVKLSRDARTLYVADQQERGPMGDRPPHVPGRWGFSAPAPTPTGCIQAATRC